MTLASGEMEQVVEPALWGLSSFASQSVTVSVDTPTASLTVTFGSQSATITSGSGRRSVTLALGAGDTGNRSFKIKAAAGGTVSFSRVKLELGAVATSWPQRALTEEQRLCQRYFYRRGKTTTYDPICFLAAWQGGALWGKMFDLPVRMRANPSVTLSAVADLMAFVTTDIVVTNVTGLVAIPTEVRLTGSINVPAGSLVPGQCAMIYFTNANNGYIDVSAEL